MKRRGIFAFGFLGLSAVAITTVLFLREDPEATQIQQPSPEVAARLKLQGALWDTSLLDLIRNARVAARKGDRVTHDAMVTGLKREPQRARNLIRSEISRSNNSTDVAILNRMIEELP